MPYFCAMKKALKLFGTTLLLLNLLACEKDVDITLSTGEKQIVVEGVIETDQQPYVTLTNSMGFFDKIDLSSLSYVEGAQIEITDLNSGNQIVLKEYKIDTTFGNQSFKFNIYGPDQSDPNAMNFKGIQGHSYLLKITANGKLFSSVTAIPSASGLDSIWTEPVPGREDSFSVVKVMYNDPDTFGNAVRIQTLNKKYKKDGSPEVFLTSFNPVYDDAIINGSRFPVTIDMGYDKSKTYTNEDFQTLGFIRRGDTVTVKWAAIDKKVFKFWETLVYSTSAVGNPFASPVKVQGNISGALGVWGGYNAQFYTITDTLK